MEATAHQRPMGRVTAMEDIPVENGTDTLDTVSLFFFGLTVDTNLFTCFIQRILFYDLLSEP